MSLTLSAVTLFATFLSHLAFQPPNQKVEEPTVGGDDDKWNSPTLEFIEGLIKYGHPVLGIYHAYLALFYPSATMCPNSASLNAGLFTWSTQSAVLLASATIFASLRLASYQALGEDFVYQINRPNALQTGGIYAYMQHPGYTTVVLAWVANVSLLLRPDGVLGCFLPTAVARHGNVFAIVHATCWLVWLASVIPPRVKDEEDMLRREFGKEWEDWSEKTARFIPAIY
jgi:protein-S-isoprenylcysteine O-methyltransferase Ste14